MTAGSSRGCLALGASVGRGPAHNRRRGFPTGPRRPPSAAGEGCEVLVWPPVRWPVPSPDRWSWLDHPGDRPDEAHHLTGDRGGHDYLGFAGRRQAAVTIAEAELSLPGDLADRLGQTLEPVEQLAADPGLHAVGPGALDQDAAGMGVAGLGDAAAADTRAARVLRGHEPKVGHELAGVGETEKSPTSATTVTATIRPTPRIACTASTTGAIDQLDRSSSIWCSRRASRAS